MVGGFFMRGDGSLLAARGVHAPVCLSDTCSTMLLLVCDLVGAPCVCRYLRIFVGKDDAHVRE